MTGINFNIRDINKLSLSKLLIIIGFIGLAFDDFRPWAIVMLVAGFMIYFRKY